MKKSLKICMVTTSYPRWRGDYSGRMIHNLSKYIVKRGHEIHVLSPGPKKAKKFEKMDGVAVHRYEHEGVGHGDMVFRFGLSKLFSSSVLNYLSKTSEELFKLEEKHDFDIIHSHWSLPSGYIAARAKNKIKKPLITHLRFSMIDWNPWKTLFKPFVNYVFKKSDRIVGISPYQTKYPKELGYGKKTRLVLNGVDLKLFSRSRIKPLPKQKNFLFVGNLEVYKGVMELIEAFSQIKSNSKLLFYGKGSLKDKLKERAKELGIGNRIIFKELAPHHKMPQIYSSCYAFVLPSIDEGGGNVIFEAMAMQKPLIVSRGAGFSFMIKNNYSGILTRPGSVSDLVKGMQKVINNPKFSKKIARNARKTIEQKVNWEIAAKDMEKVYFEIVDH